MSNSQITYSRNGHIISCFIQLSGQRKKLIATINESNRTLSKKIYPSKHTFYKSNSIAIAYELLTLDYDFIIIQCGYNQYRTTRKYFLENSDFKKFGDYELQKFLSIAEFGMDKVTKWENEQAELSRKRILETISKNPAKEVIQESLFS